MQTSLKSRNQAGSISLTIAVTLLVSLGVLFSRTHYLSEFERALETAEAVKALKARTKSPVQTQSFSQPYRPSLKSQASSNTNNQEPPNREADRDIETADVGSDIIHKLKENRHNKSWIYNRTAEGVKTMKITWHYTSSSVIGMTERGQFFELSCGDNISDVMEEQGLKGVIGFFAHGLDCQGGGGGGPDDSIASASNQEVD